MKKVTVTIGIPAHNEEKNICNLLSSIYKQKNDLFVLEKIIVLCDNCTDKTKELVLSLAKIHKNIIVNSDKFRKGKVARLNQLYKLNTSDILVTFDADIVLGSEETLGKMVKIFIREKRAVMVAAHQIPIPINTFIGKVIYAGYEFWDMTRLSVENYDHIQNHYGAATAFRKSFIQDIQFPSDITDDRGYLYVMAKRYGDFRYAMDAHIYYRPVGTLKEFCKLSDRALSKNQDSLIKYFPKKDIQALYYIPTWYKIRSIASVFLKNPLYTFLAVLLNMYMRVFPNHDSLYTKGMWEISLSTKKAIIVDTSSSY